MSKGGLAGLQGLLSRGGRSCLIRVLKDSPVRVCGGGWGIKNSAAWAGVNGWAFLALGMFYEHVQAFGKSG